MLQKSSTLISQQYISVIAWQKSNKFMSRPACWSTIFGWKLVSSHSSIWFVICQIQAHFQKLLNNIFSSKVGIGRRRLKHGIGIGRRIFYIIYYYFQKVLEEESRESPQFLGLWTSKHHHHHQKFLKWNPGMRNNFKKQIVYTVFIHKVYHFI